jgi:hypothetical protein
MVGLQHSFLNNKLTFNALFNQRWAEIIASPQAAVYPEMYLKAPSRCTRCMQLGYKVLKGKGEIKSNAGGDILNQRIALLL